MPDAAEFVKIVPFQRSQVGKNQQRTSTAL
jgi:hypothetical protein